MTDDHTDHEVPKNDVDDDVSPPLVLALGDVVDTWYGDGVVTALRSSDDFVRVRLWRPVGGSVARCAAAWLRRECVVRTGSPVATGASTRLVDEEGTWVATRRRPAEDAFDLVRPADGAVRTAVPASAVVPSAAPRFYPLLEELLGRADRVAATAAKSVRDAATVGRADATSAAVGETADALVAALPAADELVSAYEMLRDEELTVLLEKGRRRLRELMHDEIPAATERALAAAGIKVDVSDVNGDGTNNKSILADRDRALAALDNLLRERHGVDVAGLKERAAERFSEVFDSLSEAADGDRALSGIFEQVSLRTSEWQEATGRLKSTRAAGLFLESADRLRDRAASLFRSADARRREGASSASSALTAFAEGDAALAWLKGLELGDAVRSRLVRAVEVRSGAEGGLDGVLAAALGGAGARLEDWRADADGAAAGARETLLATLARRSAHREAACLRTEEALLKLESQWDLDAAALAAAARGEGGTDALFRPVAVAAKKEIHKQLDAVEKRFGTDRPEAATIVRKVRQIVDGEATAASLIDEAVAALDDDRVVARAEDLARAGERALDALERADVADATDGVGARVLAAASRAGLTAEALRDKVGTLDLNELVANAETAATNANARRQMIGKAADAALDFLLRVLPSMPVPDLDGVKDGLLYALSNLDLEGFKVRKEDILVEIAGVRASKDDNNDNNKKEEKTTTVKATELLIIDVRNVSATLDGAKWRFEQTYFPYMKGNGTAHVRLTDGSIRLQFELRKKKVVVHDAKDNDNDNDDDNDNDSSHNTTTTTTWEPALCLHERDVRVGQVELRLVGESRLVWVFNKLAVYLKGALRDYVVRVVSNLLANRSGALLRRLNDALRDHWAVVLSTAGLSVDDLEELGDADLVDADDVDELVELVWRERLPLGLNVLMNDHESGRLKVVDLPRGSQARERAEAAGLDPSLFEGATVVGVNGTRYDEPERQRELVAALRDPGRPKTVSFRLAEDKDKERVKRLVDTLVSQEEHCEEEEKEEKNKLTRPPLRTTTLHITDDGPVGVRFSISPDHASLRVDGWEDDLERDRGDVEVGDVLCAVNGVKVLGENGRDEALQRLEADASTRPLVLTFSRPYLHTVTLTKNDGTSDDDDDPADELTFVDKENDDDDDDHDGRRRIALDGYADVPCPAERRGVLLGDRLESINGAPVPPDVAPNDALAAATFPAALVFSRPDRDGGRWTTSAMRATTTATGQRAVAVFAERRSDVGCRLERLSANRNNDDVVVTAFRPVPGPHQRRLTDPDREGAVDLVGTTVESVDGRAVPSYANAEAVASAVRRAWSTHGRVEIGLSDEERRAWLLGGAWERET